MISAGARKRSASCNAGGGRRSSRSGLPRIPAHRALRRDQGEGDLIVVSASIRLCDTNARSGWLVLLDRYELVGRLVEGATSAVWEAFDRASEGASRQASSRSMTPVASRVARRFLAEAPLLELVRHEHLRRPCSAWADGRGYLFIVGSIVTATPPLAASLAPPRGCLRGPSYPPPITRGLSALTPASSTATISRRT